MPLSPARSSTSEQSFRLRPSTIPEAGIGVFILHSVRKGTYLRLRPKEQISRILHRSEVHPDLMCYGISVGRGRYAFPPEFNHMHMAWFVNHSESPNVEWRPDGFYAQRLIREGEELFFDYGTLSEYF